MRKRFFIFIHQEPIFFLHLETKKECVDFLKEYFSNHKERINGMDIAEYVSSVNYTTLARYVFYADVEELKDDIIFHTYRMKEGKRVDHLSYNVNRLIDRPDVNYFLPTNSKILPQYKAYKRKLKIKNLLDNE